jgi:hypothetical protein
MATGTYAPDPFEQMCDDDGNPLSSGTLTTFLAGLSTPATTYSDVNLTIANTNPISLDAAGRPTSGAIFLTPGVSYKFILKDVLGATVATRDNIAAVPLNPNVTGTWTPVVGGSTSVAGQTYSQQFGQYTKLGALVIAGFNITMTDKGVIVGNLQINGLPFPSDGAAGYAGSIDFWENTNTAIVNFSCFIQGSSLLLTAITAASTSNVAFLTTTDITNTFTVASTFTYRTTS